MCKRGDAGETEIHRSGQEGSPLLFAGGELSRRPSEGSGAGVISEVVCSGRESLIGLASWWSNTPPTSKKDALRGVATPSPRGLSGFSTSRLESGSSSISPLSLLTNSYSARTVLGADKFGYDAWGRARGAGLGRVGGICCCSKSGAILIPSSPARSASLPQV